jgi:hypothetical protein
VEAGPPETWIVWKQLCPTDPPTRLVVRIEMGDAIEMLYWWEVVNATLIPSEYDRDA